MKLKQPAALWLLRKFAFFCTFLEKYKSKPEPTETDFTRHFIKVLLANGAKEVFSLHDAFVFKFPVNGILLDFVLKRNSSDPHVFLQVIIEEEYKDILVLAKSHNIKLNTMVDAGANIGLASLYFKCFFSHLRVVAIEPSAGTFSRMKKNIRASGFSEITLLKKGLWSYAARLKGDYSFRDGGDWSFRLRDALPGEEAIFKTISVPDIRKDYKIEYIDFLKIDIEGGETEIFRGENDLEWLNYVKIIAIEIHDEFNARKTIEEILIKKGFELSYSGELTVGLNKKIL